MIRVSEAWKGLKFWSPPNEQRVCESIVELDLSHNELNDVSFLTWLPKLQILILDSNAFTSTTPFPRHSSLKTLSLNDNHIKTLPNLISNLSSALPGVEHLSLLKNECCPNFFVAGGTAKSYQDYRLFVISRIPQLVSLDFSNVTADERKEAKRLYSVSNSKSSAVTSSSLDAKAIREAAERKERQKQDDLERRKKEQADEWTDSEDEK